MLLVFLLLLHFLFVPAYVLLKMRLPYCSLANIFHVCSYLGLTHLHGLSAPLRLFSGIVGALLVVRKSVGGLVSLLFCRVLLGLSCLLASRVLGWLLILSSRLCLLQ